MNRLHLDFLVPGSLDQRTGGYIYDARMVSGLRRRGWMVRVHELPGVFPDVDRLARTSLARVLTGAGDDATVVIDGLAMGAAPETVGHHRDRLRIIGLVHHPLADETGLESSRRDRLIELEKAALSACRGVLVTSQATAHRLAAYGVAADRVRAVSPGLDPVPEGGRPDPRRTTQLLCVGTVIPRKGHDVLIRALTRIRDRRWSCVCVGSTTRDPAYARSVQTQVARAGLEGRVMFLGECDSGRLDELYHSSSVFVLPSHYEGYGMALTEALARGLPVVSTTAGAIPDTVPDDAGVLVAPGDEEGLAGALDELLADPARCRKLASAARRHAATLPTWDEAADAFAEAITALMTHDPTPDS